MEPRFPLIQKETNVIFPKNVYIEFPEMNIC